MSSIQLSAVGFALPDRDLFSDVHMTLGRRRQALVGSNGSGKSTLARILAGEVAPSSGAVTSSSPVIQFRQAASVDERSLRMRRDEIESALGRLQSRFDWRSWWRRVPDRDRVSELSGGELMRLRFLEFLAETARLENDGVLPFLILDEPTNDLDRDGRQMILDWVKTRGNRLLIISHDRELLENVDEIFEISSLGIRSYGGGYSTYAELAKAEREQAEESVRLAARHLKRTSREREEKKERQEKRMRRGQREADRGGMPRILVGARKRAAERTRARVEVEENERVDDADREVRAALNEKRLDPFIRLEFSGDERPASQILLTADRLQLSEGPPWPVPLSFQLKARDRIWIQGPNGAGKSSLLKVIQGHGRATTGAIWRSRLLTEADRVGVLDQSQSILNPDDSAFETIQRSTRFGPDEVRSELAFYGFKNQGVFTRVCNLSGGERLRLALARIFLGKHLPALLLLDEPTNNLDFNSVDLLRRAVQTFPGGVILITHDEVFGKSLGGFESWILHTR